MLLLQSYISSHLSFHPLSAQAAADARISTGPVVSVALIDVIFMTCGGAAAEEEVAKVVC